jgi:hypothetical protein
MSADYAPRQPWRPLTIDPDMTAASALRRTAAELRERADHLDMTAQTFDPIVTPEPADDPYDATVWDQAIEAAAQHLETGIVHYQWNGNPRRPHNYRAAANDVRTTPNPYRKATS